MVKAGGRRLNPSQPPAGDHVVPGDGHFGVPAENVGFHQLDGDPVLAAHVANTTAILTDRGMKVTRSKHGSTRPNVAAVAMVRAIALAMQEAPPPPAPPVYGSFT